MGLLIALRWQRMDAAILFVAGIGVMFAAGFVTAMTRLVHPMTG